MTHSLPEEWFERLLTQIEKGLVAPFLGAGVSACAKPSRSAEVPAGYQPSVWWLNRQLVEMLLPTFETPEGRERLASTVFQDARLHCRDAGKPHSKGQNSHALEILVRRVKETRLRSEALDALVNAARNRLDHLAEAAIWESGEIEVCKALRIDLLTALDPASAHVYLAYLAREGLVCEILTTNYDTCIEKAYERSFHPDERKAGRRQHYLEAFPGACESDEEELKVIRSQDEYRRRGGLRWLRSDHKDARPTLRLFKLNGCAFEYRQQRDNAQQAAERIILTERQLQSFRRETWAKELFRDRARCQSFVFSGFGSEEPQIRHTALAVMNEWGNNGPARCWELPNAPFMAAYEAELSFTQYQVMHSYLEAHDCKNCTQKQTDSCERSQPQNCFTGRHASWFNGDAREELNGRLPADVFWKRVFQASFLRQVRYLCRQRGPFRSWITRSVLQPDRVLQSFVNWLHPYGCRNDVAYPNTDPPSPTKSFPWTTRFELLDEEGPPGRPPPEGPVPVLRLSLWLMAIMGSETRWRDSEIPGQPYFPLRESPLLVMATLFLVYWLTDADRCSEDAKPEPTSLGLRIPAPRLGDSDETRGDERPSVYLVSREWPESNELPDEECLVRQVVFPSLSGLPERSRVTLRIPGSTPRASAGAKGPAPATQAMRVGLCVRVSAEQLLGAKRHNRAEVLRAFARDQAPPRRAELTPLSSSAVFQEAS